MVAMRMGVRWKQWGWEFVRWKQWGWEFVRWKQWGWEFVTWKQRKATDREEERRDEVNGVGHIMMITTSIPEWRHIGQMGSGSAVKGCTATEVSVKPCSHWCNRDRIPSIGAKIDRSFRWRYYLRSVHTVSMQSERWPKTRGKACRVSAPSVTKLHYSHLYSAGIDAFEQKFTRPHSNG